MPSQVRKPKKTGKSLLVPASLRSPFDQISVCVDLRFTAEAFAALAQECQTETSDFYFAASSKTDPETGLLARAIAPRLLHATIEFQKGMQSPFPRVPSSKIFRVASLFAKAKELTFRHSENTILTDGVSVPPRAISSVAGRAVRLTGFQYEIVEEEPSQTEKGFKVRLLGDGQARVTSWVRARTPVQSLEQALRIATAESFPSGVSR